MIDSVLEKMLNWLCARSLKTNNCGKKERNKKSLTNIFWGVKNTQTRTIITALKSQFLIHCLLQIYSFSFAILHQLTWIPSKEENTKAIMFLLCEINNSSIAAQTQGHIDI